MEKKSKKGFVIFLIIVILVIVISLVRHYFSKNSSVSNMYHGGSIYAHTGSAGSSSFKKDDYVGILYIEGTIEDYNTDYDQKWLLSTIETLKYDYQNVGLVVFINSPGGGVYQADEVYLALESYKEFKKPVYIYQGSMAASGGYYISCAGDKIYANRNTLTGCIGVIFGTSYDLTGLFEKVGIKSETIHSGKNKNMFNYNEPVTNEQRQIMQTISDECYKQFVTIVADSRNMSYEKAESLSDGRLYTAAQALDNGLIDGIDTFDNVLDIFLNNEVENYNLNFVEFHKSKKITFMDYLMNSITEISNAQTAAAMGLPKSVVEDMNGFNSYPAYLYTN